MRDKNNSHNKELFELKKENKKLERKIELTEKEIKKIEYNFTYLTYGTKEFKTTQEELTKKKNILETLLSEWEALQINIEK